MPKSKFLLVLALLLLLAVPATVVLSDGHGVGEGTATVFDDAGMSDGLKVSLTGSAAPGAGKEYVVWLATAMQKSVMRVGALDVAEDGTASLTFDSGSDGYTGDNLLDTYSGWAVSIEDAGSSPDRPSNQGEVSELFDDYMAGQMRTLVMAMSDLKDSLEMASMDANTAAGSDSLDDVKSAMSDVVEAIDGSGGALAQAGLAKSAAIIVGSFGEDGSSRAMYADMAHTSVTNAEMYAAMARDAAQSALDQDDVDLAKIFVGPGGKTVISLLEAAANGFDANGNTMIEADKGEGGAMHGYTQAQMAVAWTTQMGGLPALPTPTPMPTATPVPTPLPPQPTAPGLPGVGDNTASPVVLLAIVAAAALLTIGGAMSIRDRTRRVRNRA